jgi:hypothetical protein
MRNLAALMAGLAMLALVAPTAFAHQDSGEHPLPFATTGLIGTTPQPHVGAYADPPYSGSDVSGWYYGAVSASSSLKANLLATLCPTGSEPECALTEGEQVRIDPGFEFATGFAWCDFEVIGPGDGQPGSALYDERIVDGMSTYTNAWWWNGPGLQPDGLFNDGGIGAACHTPAGFYGNDDYNYNGCPTGDDANGEDAVSGGEVWVSATCDSVTLFRTDEVPMLGETLDGLLGPALSSAPCAAYPEGLPLNGKLCPSVLTGFGGGIDGYLSDCDRGFPCWYDCDGFLPCLQEIADNVNAIPCHQVGASCPQVSYQFCGADGIADAWTDGKGRGHYGAGPFFPYPAPAYNPTDDNWGGDCDGNISTMGSAVFVWNSIGLQTTPGVGVPVKSIATYGWIA